MFCGHCGKPNPDSNIICSSCGKEVRLPSAPAAQAAAAPAPASETRPMLSNLENYSGPKGVGGWLLLFWVGTTILTPIMLVMEAMNNLNNLIVVGMDVALAALAVTTGILLWARSRYALPTVRAYFITLLVIAALSILGGVMGDAAAEAGGRTGIAGSGIFQGVRSLIVVAIWWTYFKQSERVELTYGRNL
jgi:zinc ribbon protein